MNGISLSVHLGVSHVVEPLEGEVLPLRALDVALDPLALVDPGRGQGGDAHAVPNAEDDVLGRPRVHQGLLEGPLDLGGAHPLPVVGI